MPDVLSFADARRLRDLYERYGPGPLTGMTGATRGRLLRAMALQPICTAALARVREILDVAGDLPPPTVRCRTCGCEIAADLRVRTCDPCKAAARERERVRKMRGKQRVRAAKKERRPPRRCRTCGCEIAAANPALRRLCDTCRIAARKLCRKLKPPPAREAVLSLCPTCGGPRELDGNVAYCRARRCEAALERVRRVA